MNFKIFMGVPEMEDFWNDLSLRKLANTLNKDEEKLFKKFYKVLTYLSTNPRHNSLQSHEIKPLSKRYGTRVWESYLEKKTPAAGRVFWVYGPDKDQITVIGLEPHPEDKKKGGYDKVNLSDLPS